MRLTVPPEIVEAARTGEGDGMERLLQMLWPHAYRISRSVIQNSALAEDAAQEACAIIYREIGRLRSAQAFRVWAYRIVVREAVRVARHNAPTFNLPESSSEPEIDQRLDVVRALGRLPANLRAVVVLSYYADLNSNEISSVIGAPAATVRFRLALARQQLSRLLDSREVFVSAPEVCHEQ